MFPALKNFFYKNSGVGQDQPKLDPIKVGLLVAVVVLLVILEAVFVILGAYSGKANTSIPSSNPNQALQKASQENQATSQSAKAQTQPLNQLQSAYNAIVGADNLQKTLTLDQSGVATIEYVIASQDGQFIIRTSFENFADLAGRIFNINGVKRLNVTTYATKFVDQYGQPNVYALKMQLTASTNSKINWSVKKYDYKNYATILDYYQLNPLLQKDYLVLTKTN